MKEGRALGKIGLSKKDLNIYLIIAKRVNAPFIIATGSRVKGYSISKSDYDGIICLPNNEREKIQKQLRLVEIELEIKIDMTVSNIVFPSDGIMLENLKLKINGSL
jgi:predicted nucleotidyltransferase